LERVSYIAIEIVNSVTLDRVSHIICSRDHDWINLHL